MPSKSCYNTIKFVVIGKKFMKDLEMLILDDDNILYLEDLLLYFGYSFQQEDCILPHTRSKLGYLEEFLSRWKERLYYVDMLVNETARREFLIAPVLLEIVRYTNAKIRMEFPLIVNEQLKRRINYCLQVEKNLLVIKANKENLERGLIQLAMELVALDQWADSDTSQLYGVVFTSKVWQFTILDRATKQITQDLNVFRVTADIEDFLRVLIAVLTRND